MNYKCSCLSLVYGVIPLKFAYLKFTWRMSTCVQLYLSKIDLNGLLIQTINVHYISL